MHHTRARGVAVLVAAALSGACSFETKSELCDNGRRCGPGQVCAAAQDVCIPVGGCGDGVVAGDEECDHGNIIDGDGCNARCQREMCGNGVPDAGESCDDGNNTSGDSCSADCRFESKACGNGVVEAGTNPPEECDTYRSDTPGCDQDCTFAVCGDGYKNSAADEDCDSGGVVTSWCNGDLCTEPKCGDGFYNPAFGEACDTGGNTSACDEDCTVAACGDGYRNPEHVVPGEGHKEECDGGELVAGVPVPGDSAICDFDCTVAKCGDRHTNLKAGEECEDGNDDNTDDCPDGVNGTCRHATCGDGHTRSGIEECDDGNASNSDACPDGVNGTCMPAECGDGHTQTGVEGCDDGNGKNDDDCPDGIDGTCMPAKCGDGHIQTNVEECDGADCAPGSPCVQCECL